MIVEPITLPLTATLQDAESIMSTYHISGVPITDEGWKVAWYPDKSRCALC